MEMQRHQPVKHLHGASVSYATSLYHFLRLWSQSVLLRPEEDLEVLLELL